MVNSCRLELQWLSKALGSLLCTEVYLLSADLNSFDLFFDRTKPIVTVGDVQFETSDREGSCNLQTSTTIASCS